jgi:hypothetical protein
MQKNCNDLQVESGDSNKLGSAGTALCIRHMHMLVGVIDERPE